MALVVTTQELKKLLANTYALYLKTQNYHWNVVGAYFYALHHLFEDQYEELAKAVDQIAEHIRGLGESAPGSFTEFSALTVIPEAKKNVRDMIMIQDLRDSHEDLRKILIALLNTVKKEGDDVTQDLIIERLEAHKKAIWILDSHLKS